MTSHLRPTESSPRPRTRTPIVDQHATWIAVNPVQGCPKACAYCFLNERSQTSVRPEQLATPAETIDLLLASPLYDASRPVALYTWTDVMALPASRTHLAQMLALLSHRECPNPVVLITKCHIPDDTIAAIAAARRSGLRVIVYLSYSGLGPDIERGIRHEAIAANFPRLAEAGVPIVHYWRPAFPASATAENMQRVIAWASHFALCTVPPDSRLSGPP
jgi:DNA repair photolyase